MVRGEHGSAPAYAGASKPQLTVMKVVPAPALFFFAPPCQAVLRFLFYPCENFPCVCTESACAWDMSLPTASWGFNSCACMR